MRRLSNIRLGLGRRVWAARVGLAEKIAPRVARLAAPVEAKVVPSIQNVNLWIDAYKDLGGGRAKIDLLAEYTDGKGKAKQKNAKLEFPQCLEMLVAHEYQEVVTDIMWRCWRQQIEREEAAL